MRIAQIAPLAESVPLKLYGGTERVVHWLTEELVRQGHQVTLFASGDSKTSARLVAPVPRALRLDPAVRDTLPYLLLQMEQVRRRASEFDVLHFHVDLFHFPIFRELASRTVTTLHGRLDLPDLAPFYAEFDYMPLVAISHDQRTYLPNHHWWGSIMGFRPRAWRSTPNRAATILRSSAASRPRSAPIAPSPLPNAPA